MSFKIVISINDLYKIEINIEKNRIYLTLNGLWSALVQVSQYLEDIHKAIELLDNDNFTLLIDASNFITPPPELDILHIETQKMLINSGIKRVAEISPPRIIDRRTLKRYSKKTLFPKRCFTSIYKAEKWLDEVK
ncbi:MAG: hypothetical protein ACFFBP_16185 [Promethearchaeota archaeon]